MNEELEAKTASLVREAEEIMVSEYVCQCEMLHIMSLDMMFVVQYEGRV